MSSPILPQHKRAMRKRSIPPPYKHHPSQLEIIGGGGGGASGARSRDGRVGKIFDFPRSISPLRRRPTKRSLLGLAIAVTIAVLTFVVVWRINGDNIYIRSFDFDSALAPFRYDYLDDQDPPGVPGAISPLLPKYTYDPLMGEQEQQQQQQCIPELAHLRARNLDLQNNVRYQRRCISTQWTTAVDRLAVPSIQSPLVLPNPQSVTLDQCAAVASVPCEPLELQVPPTHQPRSYANFAFGVSSAYDRMVDKVDAFAHWLSGTGALLVVNINDAADHDLDGLTQLYAARDIHAVFQAPPDPSLTVDQIHFTTLRDILRSPAYSSAIQWIGLLDDDTFFLSLKYLRTALRSYNPKRTWVLGARSEDSEANERYAHMAFGGAGILFSTPMARVLEAKMDTCLATATITSGDGLIRDCVRGHTRATIQMLPGLYQHDLAGDASGFYESDPQPLITVHHWSSWYHEPVATMAAAMHWCGDCFLQRWVFARDTVLTNGYSIAVYAPDVDVSAPGFFAQRELTWQDAEHSRYQDVLAPLRPRLDRTRKKQYKLANAGRLPSGDFLQTYVYRGDRDAGEPDEVVDLLWTPGDGVAAHAQRAV